MYFFLNIWSGDCYQKGHALLVYIQPVIMKAFLSYWIFNESITISLVSSKSMNAFVSHLSKMSPSISDLNIFHDESNSQKNKGKKKIKGRR